MNRPVVMPFEQWKSENADLVELCPGAPCDECNGASVDDCPTCGQERECETCGGIGLVDIVSEMDAARALRALYDRQVAFDLERWASYQQFLHEVAA